MKTQAKVKTLVTWDWMPIVLHDRTVWLLMFLFALGIALMVWQAYSMQSDLVESAALREAEDLADALSEFRALYASEVTARVASHGIEVTHDYRSREGAIPLPASITMLLGNRIVNAKRGGYARLYSEYPFSWRTEGGPQNKFESEALRQLQKNPGSEFYRFDELDGRPVLRYATADLMKKGCVSCHNSHPDSPKTNWKLGDMRGVLEVVLPMDTAVAQMRHNKRRAAVLIAAMCILVFGALALVIHRFRRFTEELEARVAERTVELQESKTQTRSILDTAVDGIITIDASGTINLFNAAAEKIFGYSADEVRGRNVRMLMPSPDREHHDGYVADFIRNGQAKIIGSGRVVIGQSKDGSVFPMWLAVSDCSQDSQRAFTGIVRDLSDLVVAEENLQAAKSDLQAKVDALKKLNRFAVDRELRMIELKKEVNDLAEKVGEASRYDILVTASAESTGAGCHD